MSATFWWCTVELIYPTIAASVGKIKLFEKLYIHDGSDGIVYVLERVKQSDQYTCVLLTRCFVPHLIKLPVQHSNFKIQLRYHTVCYFTVRVPRVSYVRMEYSITAFETDFNAHILEAKHS